MLDLFLIMALISAISWGRRLRLRVNALEAAIARDAVIHRPEPTTALVEVERAEGA